MLKKYIDFKDCNGIILKWPGPLTFGTGHFKELVAFSSGRACAH